ncbi:MAG: hypothetical protein GF383_02275, partial [Candidatus Lokiarchaeota archaeon]|nr:hypothetical protein [Candidatus Lokiarchaeota archaeon]
MIEKSEKIKEIERKQFKYASSNKINFYHTDYNFPHLFETEKLEKMNFSKTNVELKRIEHNMMIERKRTRIRDKYSPLLEKNPIYINLNTELECDRLAEAFYIYKKVKSEVRENLIDLCTRCINGHISEKIFKKLIIKLFSFTGGRKFKQALQYKRHKRMGNFCALMLKFNDMEKKSQDGDENFQQFTSILKDIYAELYNQFQFKPKGFLNRVRTYSKKIFRPKSLKPKNKEQNLNRKSISLLFYKKNIKRCVQRTLYRDASITLG